MAVAAEVELIGCRDMLDVPLGWTYIPIEAHGDSKRRDKWPSRRRGLDHGWNCFVEGMNSDGEQTPQQQEESSKTKGYEEKHVRAPRR